MFDLILDSVKDFHTVEERRLHRIFCGLTKEFYLGRIRIDLLIPRIKENHSAILERTKEIFNTYYYGIAP